MAGLSVGISRYLPLTSMDFLLSSFWHWVNPLSSDFLLYTITSFKNIRLWFQAPVYEIQSWTFTYIWLLEKPYENEVTFRELNICLKCYQLLMPHFGKRFRFFHTGNIGSVGQMASKLLAVKVWEWFDIWYSWIWAEWFKWGRRLFLETSYFDS